MDSTRGYQSCRVWCPGYCTGTNQCLKPDIFRDGLRSRWDTKGGLQLPPVLRIRQKASCGFRALLLEALKGKHAAIVGHIGKERNGCVVLSHGSRPTQPFVPRLLAGLWTGVHKRLHTVPDDPLAFTKVQFVLEQ